MPWNDTARSEHRWIAVRYPTPGDHWRFIRTRCGPPSSLERWISSGTGESARGFTLVPRVALCVSF